MLTFAARVDGRCAHVVGVLALLAEKRLVSLGRQKLASGAACVPAAADADWSLRDTGEKLPYLVLAIALPAADELCYGLVLPFITSEA